MNKHKVDIGAIAAYIASGGLAGVAGLLAVIYPDHSAIFNAAAVAAVAIAGLVRTIYNPTPPPGQQAVFTTSVPPKTATLTTPEQNAKDTP